MPAFSVALPVPATIVSLPSLVAMTLVDVSDPRPMRLSPPPATTVTLPTFALNVSPPLPARTVWPDAFPPPCTVLVTPLFSTTIAPKPVALKVFW